MLPLFYHLDCVFLFLNGLPLRIALIRSISPQDVFSLLLLGCGPTGVTMALYRRYDDLDQFAYVPRDLRRVAAVLNSHGITARPTRIATLYRMRMKLFSHACRRV